MTYLSTPRSSALERSVITHIKDFLLCHPEIKQEKGHKKELNMIMSGRVNCLQITLWVVQGVKKQRGKRWTSADLSPIRSYSWLTVGWSGTGQVRVLRENREDKCGQSPSMEGGCSGCLHLGVVIKYALFCSGPIARLRRASRARFTASCCNMSWKGDTPKQSR